MGKAGSALALASLVIFLGAGFAGAEEVTRDSYREAVDPICKASTEANERILAGVRQEVKHDRGTQPRAPIVSKPGRRPFCRLHTTTTDKREHRR